MATAAISIISPTTLADVAATSRRRSGNCKITSITLPTGNVIHAPDEPLKEKTNWFKQLLKNDSTWWDTLVTGLAELLGTAILLFVACMGCVGTMSSTPSDFQVAVTFGFTVTCIIQTIGHISIAHINPAVTVCSVLLGAKSILAGIVYIIAQVLGAIIGYGMLKVVTPQGFLHSGDVNTSNTFCMTTINSNITPIQGLITEIIATGVLVLLCCATWDPRNGKNTDSTAIKFGLTVVALSLSAGPYTGCSMNPARSIAPALWNNEWKDHWVYWLGPIAGSVIVTLAYKSLFWPQKSLNDEIPETAALNSIDTGKPEHN